jgi:hypothetical protein
MRLWSIVIVMLVLSTAAQSGNLPDGGVSAPEVAAALKQAGYPADITAERSGGPLIRSSTGKLLFFVHFFQCDAQLRCASIQFTAEFRRKSPAPGIIAAWNRERRFGRAFLDNHGIAWIAMDVETSHGATSEALVANIARWIAVAGAFETFAEK